MPVTRPSIPVCASNASYDYSSGSWHRVIGSHPPPLQLQSRTWLPLAGKPTTFIRSSHQSARLHCRPPAPFGRPRRAAAHAHVTATVMSFCCTTLPNASHSPGALAERLPLARRVDAHDSDGGERRHRARVAPRRQQRVVPLAVGRRALERHHVRVLADVRGGGAVRLEREHAVPALALEVARAAVGDDDGERGE
eukprot:CAMPEP_0182849652 /NCGR_PEP_ID=MMETSP0006_2-20121128/29675_1 /TAXON_ID=97485 /ORGANISM="Prymnesium parvum, Strain Texoma1" /LENGTH=194 /DNA_ID=CAMNT_0024980205 /DNA_START=232 /DNA_END=813 /DNA_ORIENTATION=+